jgi:hypothetical protein
LDLLVLWWFKPRHFARLQLFETMAICSQPISIACISIFFYHYLSVYHNHINKLSSYQIALCTLQGQCNHLKVDFFPPFSR